MEERVDRSVHGLSATDTHDAKRSEDARARLCVLSEVPEEWERAIDRWRELNRGLKTELPDLVAPDDDDEYLFYQTMLGIWPLGAELPPPDLANRISSYMLKAVHEAKRHSSWINPSPAYDGAIGRFVDSALDPQKSAAFLGELGAFRHRIERPGLWNGLTQVLLKIAAPGVPDFYQGSESWNFNLVDPDNRRPIDFTDRQRVLDALLATFERDPTRLARDLLANPDDGRIKLLVTALSLRFRRANEMLFRQGGYHRCEVEGRCAPQVIAFARATPEKAVVAVAGRFFTRLGQRAEQPVGDCWRQTVLKVPQHIQRGEFRDVLTNRVLPVQSDGDSRLDLEQVFAVLPVALIEVRTGHS
jgi:(1->4)-alpha-D-glucan 1-alpha-D-glucosylmutase